MKLHSIVMCAAIVAASISVRAQEAESEPAPAPFGSAIRTEYANVSNVQRSQNEKDLTYCDINCSSPLAIALFPTFEVPCVNSAITGLRLNLGVGEHVDVYGLDIGVVGNIARREIGGIQIGLIFNSAGESDGALQVALACNSVTGEFNGAQVGIFNFAEKGCGLQLGVVNSATSLQGVQIGLLNFNEASSVPFFPIMNCAF